jgi:DNA-binding transcriptional LysR family regulator
MRLDKIDLNLFRVLDCVYSERNLTRAAEVLHLTQPAISNALARLRSVLDDPLFVRTPGGMVPTPVVENIMPTVHEALQLLGKSVDELRRFDPGRAQRSYRFSMNDLGEALLVPPLLALLEREAPQSSVSSFYVARDDAAAELASGQLDLIIDAPLIRGAQLCHLPLASQPYVCVMRHDHPLARGKLTMKRFLEATHIHVSSRRRGRGQVDLALEKLGHQRRTVLRVRHYLIAARIVEMSNHIWTVPLALAHQLSLTQKPLPFAVDDLEWHLYWHKSADGDPANRWLRQKCIEVCSEQLAQPR